MLQPYGQLLLLTFLITKELKKGFWLGVMADGPLMKEPKNLPPDYYDTWLNDKEVRKAV